MNMMQMVGIMVACYFITLTVLCLYRKIINVKIGNAVFVVVDIIFFLGWTYASYQRGWIDYGFLTFDNISPFVMTLIPLTVFMSDKIKQYCNSAIAFLWIGMFVALIISPQHAYVSNNHIEASLAYTTEAACHLLASLYGVYLILTEQVKCDFKHWKKAVVCLYSVIAFGVLMNYIFHRDYFGMNPYGDYSIYMIDIFGSFEATLLAYLLGVMMVLILGLQIGYLFNKLVNAASFYDNEEDTAKTDEEAEKQKEEDTAEEEGDGEAV